MIKSNYGWYHEKVASQLEEKEVVEDEKINKETICLYFHWPYGSYYNAMLDIEYSIFAKLLC